MPQLVAPLAFSLHVGLRRIARPSLTLALAATAITATLFGCTGKIGGTAGTPGTAGSTVLPPGVAGPDQSRARRRAPAQQHRVRQHRARPGRRRPRAVVHLRLPRRRLRRGVRQQRRRADRAAAAAGEAGDGDRGDRRARRCRPTPPTRRRGPGSWSAIPPRPAKPPARRRSCRRSRRARSAVPSPPPRCRGTRSSWTSRSRSATDSSKGSRPGLRAILLSPRFLFRVEANPGPAHNAPLDDYEVASRLSYFLWSSMPDDQLFARAAGGALHDGASIVDEVRRMLADPRSSALVDNLAGEWLGSRQMAIQQVTIDRRHLRRRASQRDGGRGLAVPGRDVPRRPRRQGAAERRLPVRERSPRGALRPDRHRHAGKRPREAAAHRRRRSGGILTQANTLTVTSMRDRTSPTRRGKWVSENLLCVVIPPPPPMIPPLRSAVDHGAHQRARAAGPAPRQGLDLQRLPPVHRSDRLRAGALRRRRALARHRQRRRDRRHRECARDRTRRSTARSAWRPRSATTRASSTA